MKGTAVKPWMRKIERGDVLRSGTGTIRIVREVHRFTRKGAEQLSVYFLIKRCSWTRRCYTIYDANLLTQCGYKPTGRHVPLRTKFDKLVELDFHSRERGFTCCDVEGIP